MQPLNNPRLNLLDPNRPIVDLVNARGNPIRCPYKGMFPVGHLSIDSITGPEAKAAFKNDYQYLGDNLRFTASEPAHGHVKGGSDRSQADLAAKLGEMRGLKVLDIAGSIWRNIRTNDVNPVTGNYMNRSLSERVWTTFVELDGRDTHRKKNLNIKLKQAADREFLQACIANRTCSCFADGKPRNDAKRCKCRDNDYEAINCTDAVYYPGVFEEIFYMMKLTGAFAIVSFVDYHKAYLNNKQEGKCCDNESEFKFTNEGVWHRVNGNIAPYVHEIVNTGGRDEFVYVDKKDDKNKFIFEKMKRTTNGDLTYVSYKITHISGSVPNAHLIDKLLINPKFEEEPSTILEFGNEVVNAVKDFSYYAKTAVKKPMREMNRLVYDRITDTIAMFQNMSISKRETIEYLPKIDSYRLKICTGKLFGLVPWKFTTYTVDAAPVEHLFSTFLFRRERGEVMRVLKAGFVTLTAPMVDGLPGPKGWGLKIAGAYDVQVVTMILAQRVGYQLLDTVMTTETKRDLDQIMTSPFVYKTAAFIANLKFFIIPILVILGFILMPKAKTDDGSLQETPNEWVLMLMAIIVFCLIRAMFAKPKTMKMVRKDPTWYETDCLHDNKLCDLSDKGRVDPKYRVSGETGQQFPNKWICDAKSKVGPVVIGPRLLGEVFDNVATQNHSCKRSDAAAVKRMVGLKSSYDEKTMAEFVSYVKKFEFPRFLDTLGSQGIDINFEEWLSRFSVNYRKKILKEAEDLDAFCFQNRRNKMHSKTDELNVPNFCQDERESQRNKVKKRAIAGPSDWEKYIANPACYAISKLSAKTYNEYNVGRNYMETSNRVEEMEEIPNVIFFAADGSGFDMTQYPVCNELWNELVELIVTHPNCNWEQDVSVNLIKHVLNKNLKLEMVAMNGEMKFECQGRGSGHGWTTVANTNLNKWYYSFLMYKAGVPNNQWDGIFQGDDSLMAVNEYYRLDIEEWKTRLFLDTDDGRAHGIGQICKKMDWGNIENMEFTSCHFYRQYDGSLRMVRIAGRVLVMFGLSTSTPKPAKSSEKTDEEIDEFFERPDVLAAIRKLAWEKHLSGLDWSVGLRIWELLYTKMGQLAGFHEVEIKTEDQKRRDDWNYDVRVWKSPHEDLGAYTHWFCNRYGVSESEIVSFEEEILKLRTFRDVIRHPLVDRIFEVDLPRA